MNRPLGEHLTAEPLDVEYRPAACLAGPVALSHARRIGPYERFAKPAFDVIVALIAALALLPLIVFTAMIVRFEFGRPILFRQSRVGRNGRYFTIYKFRTMDRCRRAPDAGRPVDLHERRRSHKSVDDPRHTEIGRLLRKFSLDELPQLWNVLRGDMSIVGPRPELVEVVERYDSWQLRRHVVKPGLTGLWQISARAGRRCTRSPTSTSSTSIG